MNKALISLLLIITFLLGCHKNKPQVVPVSEALLKACFFQKNSYWVYQDDSTKVTDCTYIKVDPVGGITDPSGVVYNFIGANDAYIITPLVGNLFDHFYLTAGVLNPFIDPAYPFLVNLKNINVSWPGIVCFVMYPDSLTNHHGTQNYNCTLINAGSETANVCEGYSYYQLGSFSNFNLNNLVLKRVDLTKVIVQPGYTVIHKVHLINDTLFFYYAPGQGIVKFVVIGDTLSEDSIVHKHKTLSWSLLRYHLTD
jgi:hypothetical protein